MRSTMVYLGDDPRYDMARSFEAVSAVKLEDACERMMQKFGRDYGMAEFELDGDRCDGGFSIWTESRSDRVAVYATTRVPYSDEDMARGAPLPGPFTYRVALYWNQASVTLLEERAIRAAIAEAFDCVLVPLPKQYFA